MERFEMNGEVVVVEKGQPFLVQQNQRTRLSNQDFWSRRTSSFTGPGGIEISSFCTARLQIKAPNQAPIFEFHLVDSDGESLLIPHEFGIPEECVVIENVWYPFDEETSSVLTQLKASVKKSPGEPIYMAEYFQLIAATSSSKVRLHSEVDFNEFQQPSQSPIPEKFLALKPWPYQELGISWLVQLFNFGLGGILGDQMGLGKTVQLIGLLRYSLSLSENRALLIVPNLTRINWVKEFAKFSPDSEVYVHHGPNREHRYKQLSEKRLTLTTYELLLQDFHNFSRIEFSLVVCDEAQLLKSPASKRRQAVASIKSSRKYLATGTPFENHVTDLWSLVDLCFPGVLGPLDSFSRLARDDTEAARLVGQQISPIMLRRTSDQVGLEIPDSHETQITLELTDFMADLYEDLRSGRRVETANSGTLALFSHLRQFCSSPQNYGVEFDYQNPKLEVIENQLREIALMGEKVVIFAHFQESIDSLHRAISNWFVGRFVGKIDGRNTAEERQEVIDRFQMGERFGVLITNPRATGMGLNIQSANHVIHFSPDWNPSKEDQATFRVLRPGQTKPVFVYRLVYQETVEEYMGEVLKAKRAMSQIALDDAEQEGSEKSLEEAISYSPISRRRQ